MKTLIFIVLMIFSSISYSWYYYPTTFSPYYGEPEPRAQVRFDIYTCALGITRADLFYLNYATNTLILSYKGSLITIPADACRFTLEQGRYY